MKLTRSCCVHLLCESMEVLQSGQPALRTESLNERPSECKARLQSIKRVKNVSVFASAVPKCVDGAQEQFYVLSIVHCLHSKRYD